MKNTIAETLRARGVRELVYFHCDHFEPWRPAPGRESDPAAQVADVETYVLESEKRDFARRATLFYKANVNFLVDGGRDLWRADPADLLGFVPPNRTQRRLSDAALHALAGRDLQVHIHHENVTWNDSIRDGGTAAYLAEPANRRFDHARFELLVRLNLDILSRHADFDRANWLFVHGHWALNAADPHECALVREIEILRRNGCHGDFTQPAGRTHVDSRIDMPYLARPVARAKGYDRPEAEPISAAGAGTVSDDRFFIWATALDHRSASIDHSAAFVRDRMADPARFGMAQAERGVLHDGVLYVKTHAHTMAPAYWDAAGGGGSFPHAHPGIVGELTTLFDAADQAGMTVTFATAGEAMSRLLAAPSATPSAPDGAHPMQAIGCDVAYSDGRHDVPPPPLAPSPADALTPRPALPDRAEAAVWPEIRPLRRPSWWQRLLRR